MYRKRTRELFLGPTNSQPAAPGAAARPPTGMRIAKKGERPPRQLPYDDAIQRFDAYVHRTRR